MICHEQAGKAPRFERDHWKEWFRFPVGVAIFKQRPDLPLPKFYSPTHTILQPNNQDFTWYWIMPLAPFVKIGLKILQKWIALAVFCYKRGWLHNISEGEKVSVFWPAKLF